MGIPSTAPTEAAPAYDDVMNNHPVNQYTPSGCTSGYTTVPQTDDAEHSFDVEDHAHAHASLASSHQDQPQTFSQMVARLLLPRVDVPHKHCSVCDEQAQSAARQKRQDERFYCAMVSSTIMTLFVCGMLLGMVIVWANATRARRS